VFGLKASLTIKLVISSARLLNIAINQVLARYQLVFLSLSFLVLAFLSFCFSNFKLYRSTSIALDYSQAQTLHLNPEQKELLLKMWEKALVKQKKSTVMLHELIKLENNPQKQTLYNQQIEYLNPNHANY